MKNLVVLLSLILTSIAWSCVITPTKTGTKTLNKEELRKLLSNDSSDSDIRVTTNKEFAKDVYATIPSDNGGNFGDLLHENRQNGDVLIMRETLINELTSSGESDMYWYGNFPARLSHLRVLNFGRERGYTLQIVTRNNEGYAEVYVRIPPHKTIRMFIEIYGFP